MEKFSIQLMKQHNEGAEEFAQGIIEIGEFTEVFQASLTYWGEDKYTLQWKQGIERILMGEKKSALISSMYDLSSANFIFWWVLYLCKKEEVYMQNSILFLEELHGKINDQNIYNYIPDRKTKNEDGLKISEWKTNLKALKNFYDG